MRKLIAILSLGLSVCFALALASAEEGSVSSSKEISGNPSTESTRENTETNKKQPGISSQTTTKKEITSSKTCTDDNGVTFKQGESGFQDCINNTKKHINQSAGQAAMDSSQKDSDRNSNSEVDQ